MPKSSRRSPAPVRERTGLMEIQRDGFGFVILDRPDAKAPGEPDVFVPMRRLGGAMHGDRVKIRVHPPRERQRAFGEVTEVLARASSRAVGKIQRGETGVWLRPFDLRLPPFRVENPGKALKSGVIADAAITRYPTARSADLACRVEEVLGLEGEVGVDLEVILRKHAIAREFPEETLREAERLPENPSQEDFAGREDLRHLRIVTIDGPDARDFDDAISIEPLPAGGWRLGVHIADVAHYVPIGSALDEEARRRGTSVYFTEAVVPMFPEKLSNGLCSLRPGVPRLAQSAFMDYDAHGRRVGARFADTVIESRQRMIYDDAFALMEGEPSMRDRYREHAVDFECFAALFRLLERRRRERGSLDFDLPEALVTLGTEGEIASIAPRERNDAHRLIEEFMLAANEAVAEFFEKNRCEGVYRVHEPPSEKKLEALNEFLQSLGVKIPPHPNGPHPRELQKVLARFAGTPEARVVHYVILRSMMQARYATKNLGHYGLALRLYTHFTSPIRRYPDLVAHRLLRARRRHRPLARAWLRELDDVCASSSEAERRAMGAERELLEWKQARFMKGQTGKTFEAMVSGVVKAGLFVQLRDTLVEGFIPLEAMPPGRYTHDRTGHTLSDRRGRRWRLGDHLRVTATGVDEERRTPLFMPAEGERRGKKGR